jgi:hypothetical protein
MLIRKPTAPQRFLVFVTSIVEGDLSDITDPSLLGAWLFPIHGPYSCRHGRAENLRKALKQKGIHAASAARKRDVGW